MLEGKICVGVEVYSVDEKYTGYMKGEQVMPNAE